MNQAIKLNKTDRLNRVGRVNTRGTAGSPIAIDEDRFRKAASDRRSLHRVSLGLWILAMLCFVLAAFVWWELLVV